jgi:hypothetical protein
MTIDDMHSPSPEFRASLEREVLAAYRSETFVRSEPRYRAPGWWRAAAVVLISITLGTTAGIASGQIRDSARRDSLLASARADAQVAKVKFDLANQRADDALKQFNAGGLMHSSLLDVQADRRAALAALVRAQDNIDEITASSQAVRDDLSAPLVGGKDFVGNRLQLDLSAAHDRLAAAEEAKDEADRRVRLGAAAEITGLEAAAQLARTQADFNTLAERYTLRQEFLKKGTPADQLAKRLAEAQLKFEATAAQQSYELAKHRLDLLERRHALGSAEDIEVLKARVELAERQRDLQRLSAQLRRQGVSPRDTIPK